MTSQNVLTADKELENYNEKFIKRVEKRRLQVETIHQVGNESSASLLSWKCWRRVMSPDPPK